MSSSAARIVIAPAVHLSRSHFEIAKSMDWSSLSRWRRFLERDAVVYLDKEAKRLLNEMGRMEEDAVWFPQLKELADRLLDQSIRISTAPIANESRAKIRAFEPTEVGELLLDEFESGLHQAGFVLSSHELIELLNHIFAASPWVDISDPYALHWSQKEGLVALARTCAQQGVNNLRISACLTEPKPYEAKPSSLLDGRPNFGVDSPIWSRDLQTRHKLLDDRFRPMMERLRRDADAPNLSLHLSIRLGTAAKFHDRCIAFRSNMGHPQAKVLGVGIGIGVRAFAQETCEPTIVCRLRSEDVREERFASESGDNIVCLEYHP